MLVHCFKIAYEPEKEHFLFLFYVILHKLIPSWYYKIVFSQTFIMNYCVYATVTIHQVPLHADFI